MREARFKVWLVEDRRLNTRTAGSRISNCKRVEAFEGDLDAHYDMDCLASLIERLTYSREDVRHRRNPKHGVTVNGDIYNGTATLKSAVGLYRDFRSSEKEAARSSGTETREPRPGYLVRLYRKIDGVVRGSAIMLGLPAKRRPKAPPLQSALPDQLRLIELKYAWDCDSCGARLPVGRQAYWSPKARGRVWCLNCCRNA